MQSIGALREAGAELVLEGRPPQLEEPGQTS